MNKTELKTKLGQIRELVKSSETTEITLALNELFFQARAFEFRSQAQIDDIVAIIKYIRFRINRRTKRAKNLFQLIEVDSKIALCLEQYLIDSFKAENIERFETAEYELELVTDESQRELMIQENISITDVPEEYQKLFLEIDYLLVRKVLELGEELSFASLKEAECKLKIEES